MTPPDFPVGPPEQRGSVRPVTLDTDPGKTFYYEVRAWPKTSLRVGAIVWVDFGTPNKLQGQWYQCLVIETWRARTLRAAFT